MPAARIKQTNQAKGTFMKGGFGGKARGNVTLEGISEQTKMEITNAAYADFISKLRAKGYNVVDRSALTSSNEYGSMSKKAFPYLADNSGFLSSKKQLSKSAIIPAFYHSKTSLKIRDNSGFLSFKNIAQNPR